jgi:TrpR-related protein YerC/YecD
MTQISKYPISDSVYGRIVEIFFKSLVRIRTKEEAERFVKDFLTPTEQIMLAKRLAIAFLLEKGYGFRTICRILRVSITTVARVNLTKKYGGRGYKMMIDKLLKEEAIKDFLLKAGEILAKVGTYGTKGTDAWRYLHQELKSKRKRKPF